MKKPYFLLLGLILAVITGTVSAQTPIYDSTYMRPGYANQVFYDLRDMSQDSSKVLNWDIAHTTDARGYTIRANHMTGLQVFSYPKSGTSGWGSFDTSGWMKWRQRWNDIHDHDKGAFTLSYSHPKYDCWTYDANTHELVGDSLFLLAWFNGSSYVKFMKFWPVRQPTTTDLIFRYANLDGSGDVTDTLYQSAASGQNYKYYAFTGKKKTVREPNKGTWDITFNRYYEPQYDPGSGKYIPYPTMGVECNRGTRSAKIIGPAYATVLADSHDLVRKNYNGGFKNDLTGIGSNWKYFNNTTFKYELKDTQSYIIKSVRTDTQYFLIHFTGFASGSGPGLAKSVFAYIRLRDNNVGVSHPKLGDIRVFPNPASSEVFVTLENSAVRNVCVSLKSLTGADLRTVDASDVAGFSGIRIPVKGIAPGVYLVSVQSGDNISTQKIVIE